MLHGVYVHRVYMPTLLLPTTKGALSFSGLIIMIVAVPRDLSTCTSAVAPFKVTTVSDARPAMPSTSLCSLAKNGCTCMSHVSSTHLLTPPHCLKTECGASSSHRHGAATTFALWCSSYEVANLYTARSARHAHSDHKSL